MASTEDYEGDERREEILEAARVAGHTVNYADDHTLQLDLDDKDRLEQALGLLQKFKHAIGVAQVVQTRSKSRNWHLYVRLKAPLKRRTRVLLQGTLGSDPVREILNWKEAANHECFLIEVSDVQKVIKLK